MFSFCNIPNAMLFIKLAVAVVISVVGLFLVGFVALFSKLAKVRQLSRPVWIATGILVSSLVLAGLLLPRDLHHYQLNPFPANPNASQTNE